MPAKKKTMSPAHKEALAVGRQEGRAARDYLNALEAHQPKPGRKRTPDSIGKRLAAIEAQIAEADPLRRLSLAQERINLEDELYNLENAESIEEYETAFIDAAAGYSERKGISCAAWREVGVPPRRSRRRASRGSRSRRRARSILVEPPPAQRPHQTQHRTCCSSRSNVLASLRGTAPLPTPPARSPVPSMKP
jgi:hypothetical protein